MSFAETVDGIVRGTSRRSELAPLTPTSKLQGIIDKSRIIDLFEQLGQTPIEIEKEVIENGKKMVLAAKWGVGASPHSQIIVSITESSISFIGDAANSQYIRLVGKDMRNLQKIEESLKDTFSNPQTI
jgi:hypothetical protein